MQEIHVDLHGLGQVHRNLNQIRHDLEGFDSSYVWSQADAMGHPTVVWAFDGFVNGWSDGRERITAQLEVAALEIEAAVEAYTRTEQNITETASDMKGGLV